MVSECVLQKQTVSAAIVLAAGQGRRMQSNTAKQYLLICGKPVLYYSLKAFQESRVDHIILVCGAGEKDYVQREIVDRYGFDKVRCITEGGKERYHSVYNGLAEAKRFCGEEGYVFIHDGARPFVTGKIIEDAYSCVVKEKACVVGMPVKDTIKIADEEGYAVQTPARSLVWMIQTPQVFSCSLILGAYEQLIQREEELIENGIQITDDACVAELFTQQRVRLVEGSYKNIKITTPEDLKIAEAFLQ